MSRLNKLTIKKFDINKIKESSNILIIGKKKTGKTTLVKDILYNLSKQKFDYGNLYTTYDHNYSNIYGKMVPKEFTFDEFSSNALKNIIQYSLKYKNKKGFVIFDDCLYNNNDKKDDNIKFSILNNYRIGITNIIISQDSKFPPFIRTNIEYIFLRNPLECEYKKLYYYFGGILPEMKYFKRVLKCANKGYGFLVIPNHNIFNDRNFYWYEAENHNSNEYIINFPKLYPLKMNMTKLIEKIGDICPICLENMTEKENMIITSCEHVFHKCCWNKYQDKHKCPYCRSKL